MDTILRLNTATLLRFFLADQTYNYNNYDSNSFTWFEDVFKISTIKEINHQSINTVDEYKDAIQKVKKGDTVTMFIKRANSGFFVIKLTKD